MPQRKHQSFLFSDGGRHIATTDDVGLLHNLNSKTLVRSICCFHLCQVNFSINDPLVIWSMFKKLKITFVWKHKYSVIINGCPEVRTKVSFWVTLEDTLQQLMMRDFFMTLMAKCWSYPTDAFIFASTTFQNPPSPKLLIGWKLSIETFGWPETPSFNMLLRRRILYTIYRYFNYNTVIWWWWCSCWWQCRQ